MALWFRVDQKHVKTLMGLAHSLDCNNKTICKDLSLICQCRISLPLFTVYNTLYLCLPSLNFVTHNLVVHLESFIKGSILKSAVIEVLYQVLFFTMYSCEC